MQPINHGRDQNFHTGAGDLNVHNVGRDLIQNYTTTVSNCAFDEIFSEHGVRTLTDPFDQAAHEAVWCTVAAVGASHTSEQQYTRGTCLEGTRGEAIGDIHTWRNSGDPSLPICWLFGKAGVGKSAIAMTVAKACEKDHGLIASFFFFRTDPKRNNPSALIPTIALGLRSKFPSLQTFIDERIHRDPMILAANLEDQFRELVLKPSLQMERSRLEGESLQKVPNLVIIDGLDECGDEATPSRILSIIQSSYRLPSTWFSLKFLISSRPEAWIQEAFDEVDLCRVTKRIALTNASQTDRDIERYLRHEFEIIRTSPQYSRLRFPSPWPSEENLQRLVWKSCRQFVYAVTAVKIVKTPYSSPLDQLRTILDDNPGCPSSNSPFPELDRLYHFILSINPNRERLLLVLAVVLIINSHSSPEFIEILLDSAPGDVHMTLRAMHSVLDIYEDSITVSHTSFRDYLFDRTRSGIFFIDQEAQTDHLARRWLQVLSAERLGRDGFHQILEHESISTDWIKFCTRLSQPSRELLTDLQNVDVTAVFLCYGSGTWGSMFNDLVSWLERSNPRNLDLATTIDRFKNPPKRFHLESSIDLHESKENCAAYDDLENDMVLRINGYLNPSPPLIGMIRKNSERLGPRSWFMFTDCRCSSDADFALSFRFHERHEAACLRAVKRLVSDISPYFPRGDDPSKAHDVFAKLVDCSLLQQCAFGPELFTLCRILFWGIDREPPNGEDPDGLSYIDAESRRNKLLDWLEVYPPDYLTRFKADSSVFLSDVPKAVR
ncbi:hypothetical protein PQX77_018370 [Marasmius sp. AFHP31]|nr:hypothetical protein PQX77_018370 [Marasmius sp. AFHP31]